MKRFKNLVIGGIQSKVFNLILITVILLTAVSVGISIYNSRILSNVVTESGARQKESISGITSSVMDAVVTQSMERSNKTDAQIMDEMFDAVRDRVAFLGDCATKLFAHPENYTAGSWETPNPENDGTWKTMVIFADGVDGNDPALAEKLGLVSNLSDLMESMCPAFGAAKAYIGLPEGVHLTVTDSSSGWIADGEVRSYDPRTRGWYQKAAEAGQLVFTDGGWDAPTGKYCVECAVPVYDPDGALQAVIGMDLFLDDMQEIMRNKAAEGEYYLLVNENGQAVLAPQAEEFPMDAADRAADLRGSETELLAGVVSQALLDGESSVRTGDLADGVYYITGTRIPTTGWVLLTAFSKEISDQPVGMLEASYSQTQTEAVALYRERIGSVRTQAVILLLAVMALTLGGALVLGRRIVKPLNRITERISELREGNLEFKMEDAYRTGDEVEELAQSFATLSRKTVEYVDTVKNVTAEKERIGTELALANQIQASMLPHIFPPFPERPEFDLYASMDPAREVGGDFYDYFLIDDDHLGLVMADVSGKGVPAALFMMASKIILQSVAMLGKSPAELLAKTNEALCSNNEAQMFVTVWMGILELSTGRLTCANAGHEYPVLKHPDGNFELYKDRHGFVLGGMEGTRCREYEIQMTSGTKLFLYTDGVPEATNSENELFGTDRMLDALNSRPEDSPRDILKNVREAVDGFVKEAEQFDDLTMLCLEYRGSGSGSPVTPAS